MNAVRKAISEMRFRIPMAVLQKAFIDMSYYGGTNQYNVDEQIFQSVIKARVLPDANLVGGQMVAILLADCQTTTVSPGQIVVKVPKSATAGRSIMSVHDISFMSPTAAAAINQSSLAYGITGNQADCQCSNRSELTQAIDRLMQAGLNPPVMMSADCEIIGENTIHIRGSNFMGSVYLRVFVANDENLSNISPRSIPDFVKLTEYAVKSYIYNKLIINIDADQLKAGYQLGVFKSIIEGYSDSEQNYQDFLNNEWAKVALMNDQPSYTRYIRMTTGGTV